MRRIARILFALGLIGCPASALAAAAPEPLSPWTAVEAEIEVLVARGELPFEALNFRPVDRGEIVSWLNRSARPASAADSCAAEPPATRGATGPGTVRTPAPSPARARLTEVLRGAGGRAPRNEGERPEPGGTPRDEGERPEPGGAQRDEGERSEPGGARWVASDRRERAGSLFEFRAGDRSLAFFPYLRAMPSFASGRAPRWGDSTRVGFRALFLAGSTVAISTGFYAAEIEESAGFADPLIARTDLILHADEATLSAHAGPLRLRLGRDRRQWGPGIDGTLLLAESAAPFDFVEHQIRLGDRLRFLAFTGATQAHAARQATSSNPARRRYVSAHRLLWNVHPDLALSLSEGARYQADSPGPLYLSGILPYTLVERLAMQDEPSDSTENFLRNNILWSLDLMWRPRPGLMLYAELLADDIATETADMPTRGGFQIGGTFAPAWRGWDWTLGAEYTRVSNYTYSVYYQDLCRCDWEHQGGPLGYARGPDVEALLLRCGAIATRRWSAAAWLRVVRKGAGEIGRPWTPGRAGCASTETPGCGDAPAWTLAEPVGRTAQIGLEARYRAGSLTWFGVSVDHARSRREGSAEGEPGEPALTRLRLLLSAGG